MQRCFRAGWMATTAMVMAGQTLSAQASRDTPLLTLSLFGGQTQSHDLWKVSGQKLTAPRLPGDSPSLNRFDTVDLTRDLANDLTFGITATKFVGANLGVSAEISHTGFKTRDQCVMVTSETQDSQNQIACDWVNRNEGLSKSSTTDFVAGMTFRPMPSQTIQLYFLAKGGVAFQSEKLTALNTTTIVLNGGFIDTTTIIIYPEGKRTATRFTKSVGVGVGTSFGRGYEFQLELRENWHSFGVVTGASEIDGVAPPTATNSIRRASLVFGVQLVLAAKRGRRY